MSLPDPSSPDTAVEESMMESLQNGVDDSPKLTSAEISGVEEPLANRLVEEAVEEAVEEVSRMTVEQKREQARELEELRKMMETHTSEGQSDLEMLGTTDQAEEKSMMETLTTAEMLGTTDQAEEKSMMETLTTVGEKVETLTTPAEEEPVPSREEEKGTEPADDYMDILGNGCLRKKTLTPGKGRESRPLHGDTVTVAYVATLTETGEQVIDEEVTFVIGDGDVMQALDLAVALTELNEKFELITDPKFAYGALGLAPSIPPSASLTITGTLIRTDEPPAYDAMPWSRIVAASNLKRERGNFLFGRNEFALSINSYNKALEILNARPANDVGQGDAARRRTDSETEDGVPLETEVYEKFKEEILETKVKIYNNLAAAQIRVEAFEAAVNSCDEVLRLSPDNVKAWFRRGKAKAGKGEYAESVRSLRTALKFDSESRIVQNELKRVLALIKNERETQQRIYRRMFGSAPGTESGDGESMSSTAPGWRRYLWYGAGVAAVGMSVALASAAFKYHQQHT